MNLRWYGLLNKGSFGIVNYNCVLKLSKNFNIEFIPRTDSDEEELKKFSPYMNKNIDADIAVCWEWLPAIEWLYPDDFNEVYRNNKKSKINIVYGVIENLSERKEFYEILKKKDLVITTSTWISDLFLKHNISTECIPLGYNPNITYRVRDNKIFTFMFAGILENRKGADIVIESFIELFANNMNVKLILKNSGDLSHTNINLPDFKNYKNIELIDGIISEEEMIELYYKADIGLAPYRAEGFGLIYLEMLASGIPVIISEDGGCRDFVNSDYCLKIKCNQMATHLEPDKKHFKDLMTFVYENQNKVKDMGKIAAERVKMFTWEKAMNKMSTILYDLGKGL